MSNPYQVVRQFEAELCAYTGATFAVTTNSCTSALLIACAYHFRKKPSAAVARIPKHTYISVPMTILLAGGSVKFDDTEWLGSYQLYPHPIYDCARCFTSGMFRPHTFQCVSFHASKILGDSQGGAVLHDNAEADAWLRRARFDGRTEGVPPKHDAFDMLGYHVYMSNDVAARLLLKLYSLPRHNEPLPNDDYPDLSQLTIFK